MDIIDSTPHELRARAIRYRSGLGITDRRTREAMNELAAEFEAMADRWDADSEQQPDKKVTARPGDVGRFLPE